jgi:hypothetical protein
MQSGEEKFVKALVGIAELAQFSITGGIIGLYVGACQQYGLDRCADALYKLAMQAQPGRGFPSIKQILEIVCPEQAIDVGDEDLAAVAAGRVIGAVYKFGACRSGSRMTEVAQYIGELGWAVIEQNGGWTRFVDGLTTDQIPTVRAQIRREAESISKRSRKGDYAPPSLPKANDTNALPPVVQRAMLEAQKQVQQLRLKPETQDAHNSKGGDDW